MAKDYDEKDKDEEHCADAADLAICTRHTHRQENKKARTSICAREEEVGIETRIERPFLNDAPCMGHNLCSLRISTQGTANVRLGWSFFRSKANIIR